MRHQRVVLLLLTLGASTARDGRAQLPSPQGYTAIPPCRIVDTRIATPAAMLSPGVPRPFHVVQGVSLTAQGGAAGGCGIPGYFGSPPTRPRVRAVMMSFIAVAPQGPGNLRAWASGPPPNASVLNYAAVPGLNIASGVVVPVDQDSTPGADILVQADVSATHLVVDVLGYFRDLNPLAGEGRPGVTVYSTSASPQLFELCTGPTGVSFSLSNVSVNALDARAACEAGFWVCSKAERGTAACDTQRPDASCDSEVCNGTCSDRLPNAHIGWLADREANAYYATSTETGFVGEAQLCSYMPVWCCTS